MIAINEKCYQCDYMKSDCLYNPYDSDYCERGNDDIMFNDSTNPPCSLFEFKFDSFVQGLLNNNNNNIILK